MLRKMTVFILIIMLLATILFSNKTCASGSLIDGSLLSYGVVSVNSDAVRVVKNNITYDYILKNNKAIPLQLGNGKYTVCALEFISGNSYKVVERQVVTLNLGDGNDVYLQSILMINWTDDMKSVEKARKLVKDGKRDREKIKEIYKYVINNVKYDKEKAVKVEKNYIPVIDNTLVENKGICYDYASLFAGMARSQGIPTKLVMGYKNDMKEYHAWNEVLIDGEWFVIDTTYRVSVGGNMFMNKDDYRVKEFY